MEKYKIGGFNICATTADKLASVLLGNIEKRIKCALFFANTNFIVQCQSIIPQLLDEHILIVNDGIGMDMANMLVNGHRFPDNLNGTDFLPFLCLQSARPLRFFLVGAKPGVA